MAILIDYTLHNLHNHETTLYRKGQKKEGQSLKLTITNRSNGVISMNKASDTSDSDMPHFVLSFPANTLTPLADLEPGNDSAEAEFQVSPDEDTKGDWHISHFNRGGDGINRFYLRWQAPEGEEEDSGQTIQPNESISFTISKIFVAAGDASMHLTTELRVQNMLYRDKELQPAYRRKPLSILNTYALQLSDLENVHNLDDLKTGVIELRDQLIPPLKAEIVDSYGLNFFRLGEGRSPFFYLRITPNPKYFQDISQIDNPMEEALQVSEETTILISTEGISFVSTDPPEGETPSEDWTFVLTSEEKNEISVTPKNGASITKSNPLLIPIKIRVGSAQDANLHLICKQIQKPESIAQGEENDDIEVFEDIQLDVPLYITPMSIKKDQVIISSATDNGTNDNPKPPEQVLTLIRNGVSQFSNSSGARFDIGRNVAIPADHHSAPQTQLDIVLSHDVINPATDYTISTNKVMTLWSDGKVGIGTDAPSTQLDVVGGLKVSEGLSVEKGNTILRGEFTIVNEGEADIRFMSTLHEQNWQVGTNEHGCYIYDDSYRLLVEKGTGHVGIGTTTPLAPLSINGSVGKVDKPDKDMHITSGAILFGGKNEGMQTNSATIGAGLFEEESLNIIGMGSKGTNRKVDIWAEGGLRVRGGLTVQEGRLFVKNQEDSYIQFLDAKNEEDWYVGANRHGFYIYDTKFEKGTKYRLSVNKVTGNVGIGTVTPQTTLDVNGGLVVRAPAGHTLAQAALKGAPKGSCYFGGVEGDRYLFYFKDTQTRIRIVRMTASPVSGDGAESWPSS